jgi:hypothetical protein
MKEHAEGSVVRTYVGQDDLNPTSGEAVVDMFTNHK